MLDGLTLFRKSWKRLSRGDAETLGGVVDWIYRRQCGVLDFDGIWRKQQMLA